MSSTIAQVNGQSASGEATWESHVRMGRAPDQPLAPDFVRALGGMPGHPAAIVIRQGWAITSAVTWAAENMDIADVGRLSGHDKMVLTRAPSASILGRFGLVALKVKKGQKARLQSSDASARSLGLAVIYAQAAYYREALGVLQDHCNVRMVGDRALAKLPTVLQALGNAHRQLRLLETWLPLATAEQAQPLHLLHLEARSVGDALSKLAGGRSFLQGGFSEATAAFELIANLYPGHS